MGICKNRRAGGDCKSCPGRGVGVQGADDWVSLDGHCDRSEMVVLGDVVPPIHSTIPVNILTIDNHSISWISSMILERVIRKSRLTASLVHIYSEISDASFSVPRLRGSPFVLTKLWLSSLLSSGRATRLPLSEVSVWLLQDVYVYSRNH